MSEHDSHDHDHDDGPYGEAEVHAHVGSYKGYFAVFVGLVGFTLLTVAVASIHLGKANLAVAVIIASLKATLVCTFFMHLKDDNKFNSLILISAITFIGIFFALTLNDVDWREQLDRQSGNRVFLQSGTDAPGSWVNPIKKEEAPSGEGAPGGAKVAPAPTTTSTASAQPTPANLAPTASGAMPSAAPSSSAAPPAPTAATSAAPHASAATSAKPHAQTAASAAPPHAAASASAH